MPALVLHEGGDDVQEWLTALGALGVGGGITAVITGLLGRRGQRVDNLAKLEAIASGIAEKATAAADRRVEQIEREFSAFKAHVEEVSVRRRVAAAAHAVWDEQVAESLRNLGGTVPPPPPLEGMAL